MTDQLDASGDPGTSLATHDTTPKFSTFLLLPDDLLFEILILLDVPDIQSLRQVCKALAQATEIRAWWIRLAHREVLNRKLLWPAYAFPLASVPTSAIEEYTLRALAIDRQWVWGTGSKERRFSRCIFRPPNSIGWLRIIRGRWLILELRGKHLEVWDLQNKLVSEPVASYDELRGTIDGSSIDVSEGSSVTISLSTSDYLTTRLQIDLPYRGEWEPAPNFFLLETVEGYSGLLDAHGGLAVFSQSSSNEGPLVRDMHTGSIVLLAETTKRLQQYFSAARILKEYIVMIGLYSMEAYSITEIRSLMRNGQEGPLPKVIHPVQSLAYPGGEMANNVEILDPPSEHSKIGSTNRESQLYLGIHLSRNGNWIRLHLRVDSDSSSPAFTASTEHLFFTKGLRTIACCWGGSGQRILLAVWYRGGWRVLCNVAPSAPDSPSPDFQGQTAFRWNAVPTLETDFFAGFAFDEASGILAVATSAGRVCIDDYSKPPVSTCKFWEENLKIPHPDPLWPILHPFPYPVNVVHNPSIFKQAFSTPMSWSAEVEHYFPMMNDPNCYGGAQWFVNEGLHISGSATLVMFTISALCPRHQWSTRVIQITGGRLVAVETDFDRLSYRVKLLGPNVGLTQVPSLFTEYLSIEGVAGVNLDVDYAVVRRYACWRDEFERGMQDGFSPGHW